MFKHLLVPLDGSRLAETALPTAGYLAGTLHSRLTLFHVVESDAPEEIHGERHLKSPAEARKYLSELSSMFSPQLQVDWHIENGKSRTVARCVQECAVSVKADSIVMCTHGRSGFRHLLLGSNAQQVAAFGTIPVLQVRPTRKAAREYSCRRIIAPLDGMAQHERGFEVSATLARAFGAELHIVSVVPTVRTLGGEGAAAARLSPRTVSAILDMVSKDLHVYQQPRLAEVREMGVRAEASIERGDPADIILHTARRTKADMIVLATHRKAGADAFWSGSVAPKIANRSPSPVLLVPIAD